MGEATGARHERTRPWRAASLYIVTRGAKVLVVRPLDVAEDAPALEAFLGSLSPQTLYRRYFTPLPNMSPARAQAEIARLMAGAERITLVGRHLGQPEIAVLVEIAFDPQQPGIAEAAVVVADAYQGQGIGSSVTAALPRLAPDTGVTEVRATALAENRAVGKLFAAIGPHTARRNGETIEYWARLG